jgi:chromosome segregation ATPase
LFFLRFNSIESSQVIREYQQEKTKLTQIENRINDLENKIKQGQITADTSKASWLKQVNQMIQEINEKFIDLFNTMGCKGEICLDIPESPVR